jgi:hypothetical protein
MIVIYVTLRVNGRQPELFMSSKERSSLDPKDQWYSIIRRTELNG